MTAGDPRVRPLADVVVELGEEALRASGERRPVVLLDGRSGAGKSSLATPLATLLDAELVRLDDVYPGWDGLAAGSEAVWSEIIPAHSWHRWSWDTHERTERHHLDPSRALLVEGCGSLSRRARELATFGIWIELDVRIRKRRALERDGDLYAPHWDTWAAQEEAFAAEENPRLLADRILDGRLLAP